MAAPPSPHPAVLMVELVEQFLFRIPPEDPADLARAALVSKQWHGVVTGAIFRRRYIEFHRSPPLLGYMLNLDNSTRFIHMSSSFRPRHALRRDVEAIHASHGRVLLRSTRDWDDIYLFVWDPITDKQWELPVPLSTPGSDISDWDAAVVCAVGDGCSHFDCPFKVVVVGISSAGQMLSCFYSSEAGSWSDPIFAPRGGNGGYAMHVCVPIGNDLYFWRRCRDVAIIVKYDSLTNQMCTISVHCEAQAKLTMDGLLIATEDGKLGVAKAINSTLRLWLMEQGRWVESRVIQLHDLLPPEAVDGKHWVSGFAETGTGVIFLFTRVGFFAVDLNSGRSKKVGERFGGVHIFPYVGFCTPAPGTVSTDVGPVTGVVVSTTDDEAGAGVAVSTYEVPRDVSTDEGQGDVVVSTGEVPGDFKSRRKLP